MSLKSSSLRELGPKVFEDFESNRVVPGSQQSQSRTERKPSYGRQNAMLNHPFEWLDDTLWKKERDPTDGDLDYDHVVGSPRMGRVTPERRKSSGAVSNKGLAKGLQIDTGSASSFQDRDWDTLQHRTTSN